jgi:DNA-binding transcriptional regulator YiaG
MPNIATALKTEISRLARKELRMEIGSPKTAIATFRHEIAALKRRMQSLERELARLCKQSGNANAKEAADEAPNLRFRPEGFAQHRQRLGLSAREVGLLLDASPLSVYKWESGQARPRNKHLEAIAALRKMGKREAAQKLAKLQA